MNNSSSLADRLSRALTAPDRGVLGLAEELLAAAQEQDLRLEWLAGNCRVQFTDGEAEVPLPKSVFRAVLACVATLCNERAAGGVSHYGDQGEVACGEGSAIRVVFVNTPEEQRLELTRVRPGDQFREAAAHVLSENEELYRRLV